MILSRRQLLEALTVGGTFGVLGGSPFTARTARTARAASAATPRFVAVFCPNGTPDEGRLDAGNRKAFDMPGVYEGFAMPGSGPSELRPGYYLKGFAGLERHVIVLDGLNGASKGDYHYGGMGEVLSNNHKGNIPTAANSPSLDQYIASRTKLPPVLAGQITYTDTVSFDMKANPQTMENSPAKLYDRLFSNLGMGMGADPQVERRLRRRKSVLDSVAKDLTAFTKRELPRDARERAEAQLQAIRNLEGTLGRVAQGCARPVRADVSPGGEMTPRHAEAQARNIAAALACGVSRSAVLQFRSATQNGSDWHQNDFGRIKSRRGWHAFSHDQNPRPQIEAIRFVMDTTRLLADELAKMATPTGTLLDETIILFCSEISVGHTAQRLCWATIGGSKLGWKTAPNGRYLKFGNGRWGGGGIGIGRLHVSILRAMGYPEVTTFGRRDGDTYAGGKNTYYKDGHVGALEELIAV